MGPFIVPRDLLVVRIAELPDSIMTPRVNLGQRRHGPGERFNQGRIGGRRVQDKDAGKWAVWSLRKHRRDRSPGQRSVECLTQTENNSSMNDDLSEKEERKHREKKATVQHSMEQRSGKECKEW